MENQNVNTDGLVRGVSYDSEPEKTYLVLIEATETNDDEKQFRDWEIVEGRQSAYDYIKRMIESDYISVDIIKSKIIVNSDKVKITDGISIYQFMKSMKEQDKIIDYSSFDIEDYYTGDNSEGAE